MSAAAAKRARYLAVGILVALLGGNLGCESRRIPQEFVAPMEAAHGQSAWMAHAAVAFDLDLEIGLRRPVHARYTIETRGSRVRADLHDGPIIGYDGAEVWIAPASADVEQPRYNLFAWPWFFVSPFILQGENVRLEALEPLPLWGVQHQAARLSLTGADASANEWYVLYKHPERDLLVAEAYLMRWSEGEQYSEVTPRAVTFKDFVTVDGVTVSTSWEFWSWDKAQGPFGDFLGVGRVSNVQFVDPAEGFFDKPADARTLSTE